MEMHIENISNCASKDGKIIERIYIFPLEEIEKRKGIKITKNPKIVGAIL